MALNFGGALLAVDCHLLPLGCMGVAPPIPLVSTTPPEYCDLGKKN